MTGRHFPAPKYAPVRDASYRSEGGEIAKVARLLGKPLMPWQRAVVDAATEYRVMPDGSRRYRYSTVLVSVPRQSGKTTLMGPVQIHRMITRAGAHCFFSAQTGQAAGRRINDLIQLVMSSPLAAVLTPRFQAGSEGFHAPNGSSLRRFAPTEDALHGETPMLVTIDEIWKFSAAKGEALVGAFSPAQITLYGRAQTWLISTMGTAASGWMNALVETGRAGTDPSLAYFEWSLPNGADPYEPAAWWDYHPALGNTITEDALLAERDKLAGNPGEWLRAYANVLTTAEDPLIDPETWDALALEDMDPPPAGWTLAYEVAPENAHTTLVASWRTDDGAPRSRVVYEAPGSGWAADLIEHCHHALGCSLAADDAGPARRVTAQLEERGLEVMTLTVAQRGSADLEWLACLLESGTFRHDGAAPFARGIANAVLHGRNGVTIIDRDRSRGDVTAPIASSVALFAYDYAAAPTGVQLFA